MPQFFLPAETLRRDPIVLRGPDARHIASVLRLQVGERLVLCDGEGTRYLACIAAMQPLRVTCTVVRQLPAATMPVHLTLAAAIIRPERYEWLIEKAFELGCRRLIPLTTERSVAKYLPKRPEAKLARWREIAMAAAKQSGLPWRPDIAPIAALPDVIAAAPTMYYCWEGTALAQDKPPRLLEHSRGKSPVILIGPEGGFTTAEHDAVMACRPQLVRLGPLILRTETAAIAAVTLVQNAYRYFA
ncbi:MAG: 16S rRNA (uracil(1498)-N(3))-methyltransferase [Deltaproteobacteria bacterium]|nr:16S rRNA (uracil(1498)-N(3))-methyltransferase [Deltaproteobacteria bacterium]